MFNIDRNVDCTNRVTNTSPAAQAWQNPENQIFGVTSSGHSKKKN